MAKIKNVELKAIKKTIGREGDGFTANVYYNKKKVGSVADYGDGAISLSVYIDKDKQEELKKIAIDYYKEHPKYYVDINSDRVLSDFLSELHELKFYEDVYKKNLKKGWQKLLVLAHTNRNEYPFKDTEYAYEDISISCNYQGENPSESLMNKIRKAHPNTTCIIGKYNCIDDFIIE